MNNEYRGKIYNFSNNSLQNNSFNTKRESYCRLIFCQQPQLGYFQKNPKPLYLLPLNPCNNEN